MKSRWILSLALPLLLCAEEANEEIAFILRDEERHSTSTGYLKKEDFIQLSHQFFKSQMRQLTQILGQNKQELLHELAQFSLPNNKQEITANQCAPGPCIRPPPLEEPAPAKLSPLQPGYNAPYLFDVINPTLFGTASFLYWKPDEEGTQVYTLYSLETIPIITGTTVRNEAYQTGNLNFTYIEATSHF